MSKHQITTTLKSIPPEIRLCIYQYLVRTSGFQIYASTSTNDSPEPKLACCTTSSVSTAVLRVCKLFHQEAQPVLLRDNVYQLLHPMPDRCSSPLPVSFHALLRTVIIGPFQSTAKVAVADMTATRSFLRSACPRLEKLSSRHWLVKHTGANIDESQDFAPILDTTYYFDVEDLSPCRSPVKYTIGILASAKDKEKPVSSMMTPPDIYTALYPALAGEDQRPRIFENWARVTTKCILNLTKSAGEGEIALKRCLTRLSDPIVVDCLIETDWRTIAQDLGLNALLL